MPRHWPGAVINAGRAALEDIQLVHTGRTIMTNAEKLTLAKARLPHPHGCHRRDPAPSADIRAATWTLQRVLSYLYFADMNIDPAAPAKPD